MNRMCYYTKRNYYDLKGENIMAKKSKIAKEQKERTLSSTILRIEKSIERARRL